MMLLSKIVISDGRMVKEVSLVMHPLHISLVVVHLMVDQFYLTIVISMQIILVVLLQRLTT